MEIPLERPKREVFSQFQFLSFFLLPIFRSIRNFFMPIEKNVHHPDDGFFQIVIVIKIFMKRVFLLLHLQVPSVIWIFGFTFNIFIRKASFECFRARNLRPRAKENYNFTRVIILKSFFILYWTVQLHFYCSWLLIHLIGSGTNCCLKVKLRFNSGLLMLKSGASFIIIHAMIVSFCKERVRFIFVVLIKW